MFIPTQGYELAYTFGVSPLQEYPVPFPHGRLQSFVAAWDSRCKRHGGQRWFDLYPDQRITPGDPLHWKGTTKRGITRALIADLLHQSSGQLSQGVTICKKLISDVLQTARS